MEHLNGCLNVIVFMWKFYTCFSRMFPFSCNTGIRVLLCFHPVFEATFTCLKFDVLQMFLCFGAFLQFSYSLEILLIHFNPVLPLCRPMELNCILMSWFLDNDKIGLKWVKKNLTGWLNLTPVWKPYLVSGKCFFSPAKKVRKFSSRFILF